MVRRSLIVEGKDRPKELGLKEFEDLGKTVGPMLCMTQPIWEAGKAIVLDSGFCVANGITELKKRGVYAAALIKKRRYWPAGVPGDIIDAYFADKEEGYAATCDAIAPNGGPFFIHCFKEPNYVMKIMATWMTLDEFGGGTKRKWKGADGRAIEKKLKYKQPFGMHFLHRHWVDDHNNRRHKPILFETSWKTKYLPDRNFSHYVAITEANAILAHGHWTLGGNVEPVLEGRHHLAKEMIINTVDMRPEEDDVTGARLRPRVLICQPVTIAPHQGRWCATGKIFVRTQQPYQKQRCSGRKGCKTFSRVYCYCTKGRFRCPDCMREHIVETAIRN